LLQKVQIDHHLEELGTYLLNLPAFIKPVVLVDTHTREKCLPVFNSAVPASKGFSIIEIPAGEFNKSPEQLLAILTELVNLGADKHTLLINLGGGVVSDIGAFAATIYKRGIRFIHIPTSLLAQIDASIGGKNGIDFLGYKNLLGTITFPEQVFISKKFLETLPGPEMKSGVAEAFKHGLIADKELWDHIKDAPLDHIDHLLERSVSIKLSIVSEDPYEKNTRKILNAGHTIGHAIEAARMQVNDPVSHGEAVAAGLIMECYISQEMNLLPKDEFIEIEQTILRFFGKIKIDNLGREALLKLMLQDKKNQDQKISFSLIRSIGRASIDDYCSEELIFQALDYYSK
jgi:3-dehydroquinate synthase